MLFFDSISDINFLKRNIEDNYTTDTFYINKNPIKYYYQGQILIENDNIYWEGYGKLWTDEFIYNGNFKKIYQINMANIN